MSSRRTYMTVFVVIILLISGSVCLVFFYPKIHLDYGHVISINGRVLDATNEEPIGDAQVLYTLKAHPAHWPVPNNIPFKLGASDTLGIIDFDHPEGYSETLSWYEEYIARSDKRDGITFTVTISKEGYVSRRFDLDTAKLPSNENGWAIADLGDIKLTRE